MMRPSLPEFGKPPLIETVLGIQFDPLPGLSNAQLGAFWASLGDEWPTAEDGPLLERVEERFDESQPWVRFGVTRFSLTTTPATRLLISNRSRDRMIQVQNGRLHLNWIGCGDQYVRYETVKADFLKVFATFRQFLENGGNGGGIKNTDMRPDLWEVTYVNQLPKGTVWNSAADWGSVFASPLVPPPTLEGRSLEGIGGEWVYEITPRKGRLRIEVHSGRADPAVASAPEVLVFKLTARGPVTDKEGGDFSAGLDRGHDMIVRSFRDLTAAEARVYWQEQL